MPADNYHTLDMKKQVEFWIDQAANGNPPPPQGDMGYLELMSQEMPNWATTRPNVTHEGSPGNRRDSDNPEVDDFFDKAEGFFRKARKMFDRLDDDKKR